MTLSFIDQHNVTTWLKRFRRDFAGRAAGLWRLQDDTLVNLALVFDAEITDGVATAFRDATARVSLSRNDLGIVKAVLDQAPAIATLADGPDGSRTWLEKFGAERSYALPCSATGKILGVLAIALPEVQRDNTAFLEKLKQVAREAAKRLARLS